MYDKINIGDSSFISPMLMTILGTRHQGRANFMALGWAMRLNYKPCLLGVCVNQVHASHKAIVETGQFSVCHPPAALKDQTDYVGLVSAQRTDKSEVFTTFSGILDNAPMIKECPVCAECEVVQTVDLPTNTMFVGRVRAVWSEEKFLTDNSPDPAKIDPFFLSMPDNRYWALGEEIGRAWHDGKKLKS